MMQSWEQIVAWAANDGTALANSASATSLLAGVTSAKATFPANFFCNAGNQLLRVRASGRVSVSGSALNLTLDLRLGSVVIANGGTMAMTTTASKTNVTWDLEWLLTLRAVGSSTTANFMHTGRFTSEAFGATSVAGEAKSCLLPSSAPAVGTGFDSTAAQQLDFFGTWGTASASNSIQVHQFLVESCL